MLTTFGPVPREKILLCSGDAGPSSQRDEPAPAGRFYRNAPWVGSLRKSADRNGLRFYVLTTGHGLVSGNEQIDRYDIHVDADPEKVSATWRRTVAHAFEGQENQLMIFFAGGCPREKYLRLLTPALAAVSVSLLTFGKPNMKDIGQLDAIVESLVNGTDGPQLSEMLKSPDRLQFYFHP